MLEERRASGDGSGRTEGSIQGMTIMFIIDVWIAKENNCKSIKENEKTKVPQRCKLYKIY